MWEKRTYVYVYVTGSPCCRVENWQNTVNQLWWKKNKNHYIHIYKKTLKSGGVPAVAKWVKDQALLQLQPGLDPWPGNFHMPQVWTKQKTKNPVLWSLAQANLRYSTPWKLLWKSYLAFSPSCEKSDYKSFSFPGLPFIFANISCWQQCKQTNNTRIKD